MKLNDQQTLGEMYYNDVLLNEAGWKGALAGAAMAASSLIPGQAKAADTASPLIQNTQTVTHQQASTSLLNNQKALKTLANFIKQNKNVVSTTPFIKSLAEVYNAKTGEELESLLMKDINAWDKKEEVLNKDEDLLFNYLNHHKSHLRHYINNVFPDYDDTYRHRVLGHTTG